ncbi:BtpA/SgcQ family protein [Candidatus Sumerlaeota bacterium]|nr:BtpA/SgcQ family protein [Candidatus Sumerlaeota bacterium]
MTAHNTPSKTMIAMVHVPALPGTPAHEPGIKSLVGRCVREAALLASAGFDALLIENMHDAPYLNGNVGPEITATMASVVAAIRREVSCPLGVQILAAANKEALAVAHACDAQFIRAEGFVYAHVGDEGIHESNAAELLRYRKMIGADSVKVFADIKKKHSSHAITSDVGIIDTAEAAEFFHADGLIVTGSSTGKAASVEELRSVHDATNLPVLVGSGITAENLHLYWEHAESFIIGSTLKIDGRWEKAIDPVRAGAVIDAANRLRNA